MLVVSKWVKKFLIKYLVWLCFCTVMYKMFGQFSTLFEVILIAINENGS